MTTNKVSDEELKQLQEIQSRFDTLTKLYGELRYEELSLQIKKQDVDAAFIELETARNTLIQQLEERFQGPGRINLETGEFVPESDS
jgi:hypothetical protein